MSLRKIIKAVFGPIALIIVPVFFASSQEATFTPEEVKKDMSILYRKLLRFHPDPFTYQRSQEYKERYLKAYNAIDQNLTIQQAYDLMAPIITDVKDLHTSTGMPKDWAKKQKKQLPLFYKQFDEHIYLSYNCSRDTTIHRGMKVLTIEGEAVDELVEKAKKYYATDNDNEVSKSYYAVSRLPNILNRLMPIKDSMLLEFMALKNDSVFTKYITTLESKEILSNLKKRYPTMLRKNFSYEVLDSLHKIASLDITTFSEKGKLLNINQRKFKNKLRAKMKQIEKDSIQTLILDLRGNGGGSIVNIPRLLGYFAKDKYKMMDSMSVKKKAFLSAFPIYGVLMPLFGRMYFNKKRGDFYVDFGDKKAKYKPAKKYHFDGNVYAIGDGGSYSATIYSLSLMQEQGLVTYVGTRAGGTRWGSFAGKWHKGALPNTKIQYRIPYFRIAHHLPNTGKKSLFIEPEVQLRYEMEDFLKQEDSFIKQTVDLILKDKPSQN